MLIFSCIHPFLRLISSLLSSREPSQPIAILLDYAHVWEQTKYGHFEELGSCLWFRDCGFRCAELIVNPLF